MGKLAYKPASAAGFPGVVFAIRAGFNGSFGIGWVVGLGEDFSAGTGRKTGEGGRGGKSVFQPSAKSVCVSSGAEYRPDNAELLPRGVFTADVL